MDWSNRDKSYTQRFVEFIEECVDNVYMYNLSLDSKDTIERIRILREGFIESEHLLLEKRINPEWSSLELELDKGLQQHEITSACERVIDTWTREGLSYLWSYVTLRANVVEIKRNYRIIGVWILLGTLREILSTGVVTSVYDWLDIIICSTHVLER